MEEHGAARMVMSSVEMGGLFGGIVGTGTIKDLRTPLSENWKEAPEKQLQLESN